jgi:molybdenum cofactor biosynthesis enzyme MoaA
MKIQMSLSTSCNIHCKFCLKEALKRRYGFIENINMDDDLAFKIVSRKFDKIQICGNRGEALVHPSLDEILRVAKENNNISFVTNASLKGVDWWKNLASVFDYKDSVVFPLDGIGNKTHNKHRKSDFYTVLRNIEAFVNAGGNAIWRYIIFEHNEHQIETAVKLANDIGVRIDLMNSHTYDRELRPPKNKVKSLSSIYFPCEHEEMYINTKGYLFPCCFMANVFGNEPLRKNHCEKELVELYEKEMDMMNLKNNSIEYIKDNSEFFKECMKKYSIICKGACYNWSKNLVCKS